MRPGTIDALVREQARRRAEALAFLEPGRPALSLGRLGAEVDAAADRLAALGLCRADRVAVALPQSVDAAVALLAAASAAVAAPRPVDVPEAEARARLAALRARALLVRAGDAGPLVRAAAATGVAVLSLAPRAQDVAGAFVLEGDPLGDALPRAAAAPDDVAVILHTSGTTAQPRRVPLTHAALVHAALVGSESLRLGPGDRSLWFAPLSHIGGLVGAVLYPPVCGAATALPPRFDPELFFDWLVELEPTWYWGVPAMHQAILEKAPAHAAAARRARLKLIRSGAAPLAPAAIARLQDTFGATVLEVYGMTEAGLLTSNPLPPRAQKPGTVGVAVGCEIAVMDASGRRLAAGEEGEVVARGPGIMRGYDGDPDADREAFRDGWLRTGDLGRLDADGYLTITGRLKEQVNRGGVKVSPRAVDDVLLSHPAVAAAAAFPVPHARLGEDLAAAVVLRAGSHASPGELRAFLAARAEPSRVPGRILVVDAIPAGPTGKPQRGKLAEQLGALTSARPAQEAAAVDDAEASLCRIWAEVLERPAVGPDDDFFDLGGDSVAGARLMRRIADQLGVELPIASLLEAPTPGALLHLVRVRGAAEAPTLVPLSGPAHGVPLVFCVGWAPVLQLQRLARRLAATHRVYALYTRGLDRLARAERVEAYAESGIAELHRAALDGAVELSGFCFGAVVAFEMAQRLDRAGRRAPLLALFDPPPLPMRFRHRVVDRARARVAGLLGRPVVPGENLRRALARYRPAPYAGRSLLFFSDECPPDGGPVSAAAWKRIMPAGAEVQRIAAGHARLFEHDSVSPLVERISSPA